MNRLEPLLKSGQRITLVMEPAGEDKGRVTYINWDGERIILAEQSVEVLAVDKTLYPWRVPRDRRQAMGRPPRGNTVTRKRRRSELRRHKKKSDRVTRHCMSRNPDETGAPLRWRGCVRH